MQINVKKLRDIMDLLHPAVAKKTTLPIIKNIRVGHCIMEATDLEKRISVEVKEADGCDFLIPYASAVDLLKYVPGDEMVTIDDTDKKMLKFSWEGGKASLASEHPKDYPPLTLDSVEETATGDINGDIWVPALMEAIPYAATEEARPLLTGIMVSLGEVMMIAGADGFRLSFQSLNLPYPDKETITIPASTVTALQFLWKKAPLSPALQASLIAQITARRYINTTLYHPKIKEEAEPGQEKKAAASNLIQFKFGTTTLTSQLISGSYPDVLQLIPKDDGIKAFIMAPELYTAVKRAKEISGGVEIIRLSWTNEDLTVAAKSEELGEVEGIIKVLEGSTPGKVALRCTNLLDYLNGKSGMVVMTVTTPSSPVVFRYGNMPVVVLMPMFVQWPGDPVPEGEKKEETGQEDDSNDPTSVEYKTDQPDNLVAKLDAVSKTSPKCEDKTIPVVETKKSSKRKTKAQAK